MPSKTLRGKGAASRLEECWAQMVSDEDDHPTAKEFAARAGISSSTLYHVYPEWAEKFRLWRDKHLERPRRLSPAARKRQKEVEVEAQRLIGRLRKELSGAKAEIQLLKKERDRYAREAKDSKDLRETNERLRSVVQRFGEALKKHLDAKKAQEILDEMARYQERHLRVVRPDVE